MQEKHHQKTHTTRNNKSPLLPGIPLVMTSDNNNDHAHQLQTWLNFPTAREQRRYLEHHCDLLDEQSETVLHALLAQAQEGSTQAKQRREALLLLQDVQRRGGTMEAIREAYINLHGGFVLDLPPWLEAVEQHLTELLNQNSPDGTAETRVELLQEALEKAQEDAAFAPELLATFQRELADAWWRHPHTDRSQAFETTIKCCEEALLVFTVTRYPSQYAKTQNRLGTAYWERIAGERRENLERAIDCYQETLRVHTFDAFPFEYGKVQNNLGIAYGNRIAGERRENLERAIACFHEALHVRTLDAFPFWYASTQGNLGITYGVRIVGERRENLEQAIACYHEALRVYTLEAFPFWYASTQGNLGNAYRDRIAGERRQNLAQAIACHHEALRVLTFDAFPFQYALLENDLGQTYTQRIGGERRKNLEQAIICYQEALRVYTVEAFPHESRSVHVRLAETEAQRENWQAVQDAYIAALRAEDLLVILGTGTLGRDAILKEGGDAAIRLGYALYRLGCISEAAVAIERGRARGLAEAMAFDAADPMLIADEERKTRYTVARAALVTAQTDLHTPISQDLDEDVRRRLDLERTVTYRQAKATFDTLITEIREANDPAEFLNNALDAATILRAAKLAGSGHTLVYLVATPWGGVAIAALGEQASSTTHFTALELPGLTEAFVTSLTETHLQDDSQRVIGGFALAQMGEGFERLCQQWDGETFQAKAQALRAACHKTQQESTLDLAAQTLLSSHPLTKFVTQPLSSLSRQDRSELSVTFDYLFLQNELDRCLQQLGTTIMHPLISWLREQGVTSLTLISCGHLATFPLTNVVLADGRSVSETFPTSVAPSARALLLSGGSRDRDTQAGVYALGDPHHNLPWSEAEALTLIALARRHALPAEAHVKGQATREHLLSALGKRWIVDASCHGKFDQQDFLQSALLLAHKGQITISEMITHQVDLCGLRLLLLSACQTAQLDLHGARDEVHSLATAMLQAGAPAVLASQWPVDDKATYLLMIRFAQEWLPQMKQEPPVAALARAQFWLRHVTNKELALWHSTMPTPAGMKPLLKTASKRRQSEQSTIPTHPMQWERIPVRGRSARYDVSDAQLTVRIGATVSDPAARPFADPYFWAGFQVIGW